MEIVEIEIHRITVDHDSRRPLHIETVKRLTASIELEGLLHPITVRLDGGRFRLVAGAHRLEAASNLGWETVPAKLLDLNDHEAESIEIEENLTRFDLSKTERDALICKYAALLKLRQSDAVSDRGGRGRKGLPRQVAEMLGFQKKTVERALKGQTLYPGREKRQPQAERQGPEMTPSYRAGIALQTLLDVWVEIGEAHRASIKAGLVNLPGGEKSEGPTNQLALPPWEYDDLARRVKAQQDRALIEPMVLESTRRMARLNA